MLSWASLRPSSCRGECGNWEAARVGCPVVWRGTGQSRAEPHGALLPVQFLRVTEKVGCAGGSQK